MTYTARILRGVCMAALLMLATIAITQEKEKPPVPPPPSATDDYSGMYNFLQEGEFVQLDFGEEGKLQGFISSFGTLESDKGAFLDRFLKSGSWKGHDLSFVTGPVHGTWFEFKGQVVRGEGKTRAEEGYYLLKGTLTEYTSNEVKELCGGRVECAWRKVGDKDKTVYARSRDVSLKSFPQDLDEAPKKKNQP
jgi:hypothetical protein